MSGLGPVVLHPDRGPREADREIVLDGFLGDRARLDRLDAVEGSRTDTDRLRAALAEWGDEAPNRLHGEWAYVVHDPRRASLEAVRGPLGVRPLFHAALPDGGHAVAGDVVSLLALGADASVDEVVLLERLVPDLTDPERTLHRGVRRVPAGHRLVVDASGVRVERWWHPRPRPDLESVDEATALAAVGEALAASIRDRLEGVRSAAVDLSGGLDSAVVAALAAGCGNALEAATVTYDGLACDETAEAAAVADALGLPHRTLPSSPIAPADLDGWIARHRDPLCPAMAWTAHALHADGTARGIGVRLDGEGGDEWFGWTWAQLADHLARGELGEAWDLAGAGDGAAARTRRLVEHGLRRVLPLGLRRAIRRARAGSRLPPWIGRERARAADLDARLRVRDPEPVWGDHDADTLWFGATGGFASLGMEFLERWSRDHGFELRHPFHDRRVVEAALSLPGAVRRGEGGRKALLRGLLRERLPGELVERSRKAEFGALLDAALDRFGGAAAFDDLRLAHEGVLDGARVSAMAERTRPRSTGREAEPRHRYVLWSILATERWWRASTDR